MFRTLIMALVAFVMVPSVARADEPVKISNTHSIWVDVGLGPGGSFTDGQAGFGGHLQVHALVNQKHLWTLGMTGLTGFTHGFRMPQEFNLLYGRATTGKYGMLFASAGLAGVSAQNDQGKMVPTIGLPLAVGAIFTPVPFLGLGLELASDLNPVDSYGTLCLTIHLGAVRPGTLKISGAGRP